MVPSAPDLMGVLLEAEARVHSAASTTDVVSWLSGSGLDAEDQEQFFRELKEAIAGSPEEITDVLHAWRLTAQALSDPTRREILLGDNTHEDYVEVERPE
jgi:hypothetical protein